ncbi:MAG: formate--tetrahydrofolate ligase [Phycisphaerales bacterium JB063]
MADKTYLPDIDIARAATLRPIPEIAAKLGLSENDIDLYGKTKAKVTLAACEARADHAMGKLVLVTAISPTPAGEGKTTTTVGLGDALSKVGKKTCICLREPSLGPCFGMKGGAAGGGYAQVVPMEDINLHFTGDFHAIGLANNLLAAAIDNHIHHGNALGIDTRRIVWRRVVDMNDRALRKVTVGLGGVGNGYAREDGYDITVASEVMAIFCLSQTLGEMKQRLGEIIVAYTRDRAPVRAADLRVHGAMTVLLKDAFAPNLVQTLEGTPALVHGGPFANIAHGCNSVMATKLALQCADFVVTEAGFGADLGAEKFMNIKCRKSGLRPDAAVIVATVRALKSHGGVDKESLNTPDVAAVTKGIANLTKHVENVQGFGIPCVVCINTFVSDTDEEVAAIREAAGRLGVDVIQSRHWEHGGAGAEDLARHVVALAESGKSALKLTYDNADGLWDKVKSVAQNIYGADDIEADFRVRNKIRQLEADGYGNLPVCMAKTQYSLSTDAKLRNRPTGFNVPISDVRLSAGAGFVVVLTGDIMTMPGLPKHPAAEVIDLDDNNQVVGLF